MVREGLRDLGYRDVKTVGDAHEVMKNLFLKKTYKNDETGQVITIVGSTTDLTTVEFNEYLDEIIEWAAEYLSISIPPPSTPMELFAEYDKEIGAVIIDKT